MSKRYHEGNANDPKNGEGHRAFAKKAAGEFAHLEKKRTEGIKRAAARLKEEIESVEEISKETLKSYMDKAKDAAEDHRSNEDYLRSTGENQAEANKEQKKYWKRTFGRKAAYQKLLTKEEVESVDEISTPTLRSYIGKAGKQTKGNQPSDPNKLRKRTNREKGINLAARKIFGVKGVVKANEEVEPVEELSKPLLTRYVKKAIARAGEHDYTSGMMDADGITGVAKHHANLGDKKRAGISKAVDRLASVKEGTGTDGTIPVKRNTDGIKSGAGLTGTPELVWKYKSQTPGQNQKTETVTPSTDAKIREFVEALDEATQFTISFDKNDKKSALLFAAKVDDIKGASVLNVTGKNLIVKASDDIEDEFATIADELGVGIKIKKS